MPPFGACTQVVDALTLITERIGNIQVDKSDGLDGPLLLKGGERIIHIAELMTVAY